MDVFTSFYTRIVHSYFLYSQVRQVSNNILSTEDAGISNDSVYSHMVTLFGQWNDHDLTFTPFSPSIRSFSNGVNCEESCEHTEPCIPIPVSVWRTKPNSGMLFSVSMTSSFFHPCFLVYEQLPPGDSRLSFSQCIPAFRSAPACGTGYSALNFGGETNRREQVNALTAFLDLSQVYGSEDKLALTLRNLTDDGGLLRVNTEFRDNGRELLPFHSLQVQMCATRKRVTNDTNAREIPCFIAG